MKLDQRASDRLVHLQDVPHTRIGWQALEKKAWGIPYDQDFIQWCMRSWLSLVVIFLVCSGCSESTVLTRADATAEDFERDRHHCQAEMYTQRMARGRGAPSWTIYDYCMKARGYTREKAGG
jgi:hypothetical protein